MTDYGPPDDSSEAPTGSYDYSGQDQGDQPGGAPWYRKPIILVALSLFAAILVGMALYFLADQSTGGGTTQTPTSPTTSTGATTTTTAELPTTSTEPLAPAPTTTMTFAPTTTEPSNAAPATTAPASTSVDEGHHHHHHHDGGTP